MKMHGLGNDFVVLDARAEFIDVSPALARALGDRHRGVGFDQLAVMQTDDDGVRLTFYNADGSLSAACGNATRCIARHIMTETNASEISLTTDRGVLHACDLGDGSISVNMGHPQLNWNEIPLAEEMDTLKLPIEGDPTATGMGNPHCTFFVENVLAVDVETRGAAIETHPLYPERTNVQFAEIIGTDHIRMRVWERGAGLTLASGSSSCATAVAAVRRGLTSHSVRIDLDGGTLYVAWKDDGVWMTGPTTHVFNGTLTAEFLKGLQE